MKENTLCLIHIVDCIVKIEDYTRTGREAFQQSPMAQDAVIRNLEIIGEASRKLDEAFRDAHPEIPWNKMAALRNVLIHNYPGVDRDAVWLITQQEIPEPLKRVTAILGQASL